MKIAVCIKQVPNTTEIKIDPTTGTMIREGIDTIINPDDKVAVEEALRIKEKIGVAEVIVVTMGPPQAESALKECLAMGCDKAILVTDRKFAGSDTAATSYILSKAINKIGDVDLIICGRQAIDGDTAQTGPQIAQLLNLPQITYVQDLKVSEGKIRVQRQLENGYEVIEAKLPALITVIKELNIPRYPTLYGIQAAVASEISVWGNEDIKADSAKIGLLGSPTKVKKSFSPPPKGNCKFIEGSDAKEIAKNLVSMLKENEIIQEF